MGAAPAGQIITFYSYKGGTGRSMALANVGYILATEAAGSDRRVLLIDWDLEAPGLHRFFPDSAASKAANSGTAGGLIDFFEWAESLYASRDDMVDTREPDLDRFAKIRATVLDGFGPYERASTIGNLWIVHAGTFNDGYAHRVRKFDWERFHHRDPRFFGDFRRRLATRFAVVLIDSRTGLTDTSGICAQQMPDKLVLVFAPNHQNVDGVLGIARKVTEFRTGDSTDARPLSIFPLASRIDATASRRLTTWRKGGTFNDEPVEGYQVAFEKLLTELYELDACDLESYFDATQVKHDSDYAFGESIAAKEGTTDPQVLGFAYANFTKRLMTLAGAWESLPEERLLQEARRRESEAQEATRAAEAAVARAHRMQWLFGVGALVLLTIAGGVWVAGPVKSLWNGVVTPVKARQRIVGDISTSGINRGAEELNLLFEVPPEPRDYFELSAGSRRVKIGLQRAGEVTWAKDYGRPVMTTFTAKPESQVRLTVRFLFELSAPQGSYELVITPLHRYDAFEPNDDLVHAKTIALNTPVTAEVMDSDDADFFAFTAVNGPLEIKLEKTTGELWPYVTVYDGTGKAVADKFPAAASQVVTLTVPDDTRGPVRIGIVGRNFTSGGYVLTVRQGHVAAPPAALPLR